MRTRIGFKQFNPNKPAKYGISFKSINAGRYPYTFRTPHMLKNPEIIAIKNSTRFMFLGLKIQSKGL